MAIILMSILENSVSVKATAHLVTSLHPTCNIVPPVASIGSVMRIKSSWANFSGSLFK